MAGDGEILFVHIREAEEIKKFVEATGGKAKTLLVRAPHRMAAHVYGNPSDDLVEHYPYDYVFDNDAPRDRAGEEFLAFLAGLWE